MTTITRSRVLWGGVGVGILALALASLFGCAPLPPEAKPFTGDRFDEWGRPLPAPAYTNRPWTDFTNEAMHARVSR